MRVVEYSLFSPLSRSPPKSPIPNVQKVFGPPEMSEFLGGIDYLINVLPSTPQTRHILSADLFKSCKKGMIFINVGRGDVIEENSLVEALEKGYIAGAVLG